MKALLPLVALLSLLTHSAFVLAQDQAEKEAKPQASASHRAAAEKLLEITNTKETMQKSIDQMLDLQLKQAPQLAALREPMRKFMSKHLSYDSLKEDLITMYTEEFTEAELKELMEFYKTPLGKKAIEKLPVLMAKGAQIGASRVEANKGELQQMIRDELQKRSGPPRGN